MTSPTLTAALRYAAAGWPVFWLGRTKRPLANCDQCKTAGTGHDPRACTCLTCHGFYAATTDPHRIRQMHAHHPHGTLAIRTGSPSGLLVVDVDPRNGGHTTLRRLITDGLTPPTRWVRTGSGGLHLYYRHPGPHTHIPGGRVHLGAGVDVKADGGYVVAPPSLHPATGCPYAWADETAVVREMAPPLRDACRTPSPATTAAATPTPPTTAGAGAISHPDRLLAALLDAVRHSSPGRRRVTLYGSSRGVARMVAAGAISPTDAQAALLEVGLAVGQTKKSALAAISGGFRDEGVPA